jgi:hypothetical protein
MARSKKRKNAIGSFSEDMEKAMRLVVQDGLSVRQLH